jgi:hypothetical protein
VSRLYNVTDNYQREIAYTVNEPDGKTGALEALKTCLDAVIEFGVRQTRTKPTNSVPVITHRTDSRNTVFQQNGDVDRKILVV